VVHFKGHPHVHAYVHVARDPLRANVGEALAETPTGVEGDEMRGLLEGAFRRATGEALAFGPPDPPGRFCPGPITTGLAHAVDPFRESIVLADIDARAMAAPLRERLAVAPTGHHRVATTSFLAHDPALFGQPDQVRRTRVLVRDALIAHLRAGALRSGSARPG
jgi:hypothetical protein